jgi:uncharacterized protein YggE
MKFLLLSFFLVSCASARPNKVQVEGTCDIKVVPDRGMISFTAENQSKDQTEAVKKTTDQMNELKVKIKNLNLKDLELKNTNYSVYPVREWEKERQVDKGTRATLTLEVTTSEIGRLGATLTEASKIGIQNVGSLQTFLSIEKAQKEYLKCLDIAAEDARVKATQLAKALDFKVGEVIKIIETPTPIETPPRPERAMMLKGMPDMTPSNLEAGEQQFSTKLQVTFKIK